MLNSMRRFFKTQYKHLFIALLALSVSPFPVFAQSCGGQRDLRQIICTIADIFGYGITLAFSLALMFFFWGAAQFIFSAGDVKAISEGKYKIFWGAVVLFVLSSVWGLVRIIRVTFFG